MAGTKKTTTSPTNLKEWESERDKIALFLQYTGPNSIQQVRYDNACDQVRILQAQVENDEPDWDNIGKQMEDDRIWAESQP